MLLPATRRLQRGTGRYVLWADGGGRYLVATSPTPTGIFAAAIRGVVEACHLG